MVAVLVIGRKRAYALRARRFDPRGHVGGLLVSGSGPNCLVSRRSDGHDAPMTDELSAALEAVVSRFATMVRSVAVRHRLSDADLDEIVQEVRIRLWKSCSTSEQIRALGTSYVYRTATSAALDLLRRRRAHGADRSESVDSMAEHLPDTSLSAAGTLDADKLQHRVLAAIEGIPSSRRGVVRMHLAGYAREEIAALMGWSEAKTRNLLYRGLADLRMSLAAAGITRPT